MVIFVHRFLEIRRPGLERAMGIMLIGALLVYLGHYFWWQTRVNFVFHGIALLLGVYNVFIASRALYATPSVRLVSLLVPLIVITGLTLHDNLFSRGIVGDTWFTQFYAMQLGTPLLLGFLLVVLLIDTLSFSQSGMVPVALLTRLIATLKVPADLRYPVFQFQVGTTRCL